MSAKLSLSFDPLSAKYGSQDEDGQLLIRRSIKREIKNILTSYNSWFDPFSESIQNALDSVDKRTKKNEENYQPSIWITIDLDHNSLTVTDNGIGLDEKSFKSFLAPSVSYKSSQEKNRGRKGVGATYLAYGFNHIKISTKTNSFHSTGKMLNARQWVDNIEQKDSPRVVIDETEQNEINYRLFWINSKNCIIKYIV
jgi:hypothetical protein